MQKAVNSIQESWAAGHFTGPSEGQTIQVNAQAIGQVQALKGILDLSYDELMEVINGE